jgi:hypothetical protein
MCLVVVFCYTFGVFSEILLALGGVKIGSLIMKFRMPSDSLRKMMAALLVPMLLALGVARLIVMVTGRPIPEETATAPAPGPVNGRGMFARPPTGRSTLQPTPAPSAQARPKANLGLGLALIAAALGVFLVSGFFSFLYFFRLSWISGLVSFLFVAVGSVVALVLDFVLITVILAASVAAMAALSK